ncbi:hypothetical protein FRC11_007558, partial [Ceratobasidium sp. 423]
MPNIAANSTAAYFAYTGRWSRSNTDDPGRRVWQEGDSIDLSIQGSTLYLFGNPLPEVPNNTTSSQYTVTIRKGRSSALPYIGNVTASDSREGILCTISSLDVNQPINLKLSLTALSGNSSGLSLSRVEWTDPNASDQSKQSINGSLASVSTTNWTTQGGSRCTSSSGSNITFNLGGTSVIVKGMAMSQNLNATYKVFVNNVLMSAPGGSNRWEAYASANQEIDL